MAENRGGNRPTAPQNNFAVSGTGGAGNGGKGQPARYAAGMDYGEGQAFYDLQTQAPMSQSGPNVPAARANAAMNIAEPLIPLNAPTQRPDEPITTGVDSGAGPGSEVLTSPAAVAAQNNDDLARLAAIMPVYARIAESPYASNATRNFYRYLRSQL